MTLAGPQIKALMGRLNPNRVAQRDKPGSKQKMSYLEAWDVKAKLITVFGFANFDAEVLDPTIVRIDEFDEPQWVWENGRRTGPKLDAQGNQETKTQFRVVAMATYRIRIHATGATYSETAVAGQKGADLGEVADFAMKTAESDALKRCATFLGTQFGLSLYASDNTHVHYDDVVQLLLDPEQSRLLDEARAQSPSKASNPPAEGSVPDEPRSPAEEAAAGALAAGFKHPEARSKS